MNYIVWWWFKTCKAMPIFRHLFWIKSRKYSRLMLDIDARMPLKIRPIMTFAGDIISPIIFVREREREGESVCMKVDITLHKSNFSRLLIQNMLSLLPFHFIPIQFNSIYFHSMFIRWLNLNSRHQSVRHECIWTWHDIIWLNASAVSENMFLSIVHWLKC